MKFRCGTTSRLPSGRRRVELSDAFASRATACARSRDVTNRNPSAAAAAAAASLSLSLSRVRALSRSLARLAASHEELNVTAARQGTRGLKCHPAAGARASTCNYTVSAAERVTRGGGKQPRAPSTSTLRSLVLIRYKRYIIITAVMTTTWVVVCCVVCSINVATVGNVQNSH